MKLAPSSNYGKGRIFDENQWNNQKESVNFLIADTTKLANTGEFRIVYVSGKMINNHTYSSKKAKEIFFNDK